MYVHCAPEMSVVQTWYYGLAPLGLGPLSFFVVWLTLFCLGGVWWLVRVYEGQRTQFTKVSSTVVGPRDRTQSGFETSDFCCYCCFEALLQSLFTFFLVALAS